MAELSRKYGIHANMIVKWKREALDGMYYKPKGESALNLSLMEKIDRQHLTKPWYGARQMARFLRRQSYCISRKRIGRLMRKWVSWPLHRDLRQVKGTRHMQFTLTFNVTCK